VQVRAFMELGLLDKSMMELNKKTGGYRLKEGFTPAQAIEGGRQLESDPDKWL